jgi:hypothetical protein
MADTAFPVVKDTCANAVRKATGEQVGQRCNFSQRRTNSAIQLVSQNDRSPRSTGDVVVEDAPGSESFPFFSLPFDCRQAVLLKLFPESTLDVYIRSRDNNYSPAVGMPFPPIVRTAKRLRAEALYMALKQTDLAVHSEPGNTALCAWLSSIDLSILHGDIKTSIRSGFDAITKLTFPWSARFPFSDLPDTTSHKDVELMKKCANLQQLSLKFRDGDVIDHLTWEEEVLKTPRQLAGTVRMFGALELKDVKKIIFVEQPVEWHIFWEVNGIMELQKLLNAEHKKFATEFEVNVVDE